MIRSQGGRGFRQYIKINQKSLWRVIFAKEI